MKALELWIKREHEMAPSLLVNLLVDQRENL